MGGLSNLFSSPADQAAQVAQQQQQIAQQNTAAEQAYISKEEQALRDQLVPAMGGYAGAAAGMAPEMLTAQNLGTVGEQAPQYVGVNGAMPGNVFAIPQQYAPQAPPQVGQPAAPPPPPVAPPPAQRVPMTAPTPAAPAPGPAIGARMPTGNRGPMPAVMPQRTM